MVRLHLTLLVLIGLPLGCGSVGSMPDGSEAMGAAEESARGGADEAAQDAADKAVAAAKAAAQPADAPRPAAGDFAVARLVGKYAIGGHDTAFILDLKANGNRMRGTVYRFDAGLDGKKGASARAWLTGDSMKISRSKAVREFTVDPRTGAIAGDLGAGQVKAGKGGMELHLGASEDEFFQAAPEMIFVPATEDAFVF